VNHFSWHAIHSCILFRTEVVYFIRTVVVVLLHPLANLIIVSSFFLGNIIVNSYFTGAMAPPSSGTRQHLPPGTRVLSHPYYQDSNSTTKTKVPAGVLITSTKSLVFSGAWFLHASIQQPIRDDLDHIDRPKDRCLLLLASSHMHGPCCDPAAACDEELVRACLISCAIQRACRCC